jgi:HD-like signal output (HDOD) protein
MKKECAICKKKYDIPEERLPRGKKFSFPCPSCKHPIEIDLRITPAPAKGMSPSKTPEAVQASESAESTALRQKILKSLKDLPPMPQVLMKAREIMDNPNSGFPELSRVLETDQAIAAKVLRMANSPYYGLSGKVSSIQHASVVLGFKTVGELVTMAGSSSVVGNALEGYELEAGALWSHSMAVAFGSRIIAKKKRPELANDAFSAGLIHDAGKLILDKHVAQRKPAFEAIMGDGGKTFLDAEKEILGFDHGQIAAEACKKWNIPATLAIPIQYHHYPDQSNGNVLSYILHVSDSLAIMSGIGTGIDGMLYRMDEKALDFLGLTAEDLDAIIGEAVESVEHMQKDL